MQNERLQKDGLRLINEPAVDAALDKAIRNLLMASFPEHGEIFAQSRQWHGSRPVYSILMEYDGAMIAHAGVVDREIMAGSFPVRVAGMMNVVVAPAHRGQKVVDRVLAAAMDEAGKRRFDAGLLFCGDDVKRVYLRNGWRELPNRLVTRVDEGKDVGLPSGNSPMYFPLAMKHWPAGDIHLRGNDW